MEIEIIEITGWKWQTLDEIAQSEIQCMDYFKLPMGDVNITDCVLNAMPCYSVYGGVDFYYIALKVPDQFIPILGEPTTFEITLIIDEEEKTESKIS